MTCQCHTSGLIDGVLGLSGKQEGKLSKSPWGLSSTNKAYFTCAAWFKFFWTEAFIDVEVQINGTWVDVED